MLSRILTEFIVASEQVAGVHLHIANLRVHVHMTGLHVLLPVYLYDVPVYRESSTDIICNKTHFVKAYLNNPVHGLHLLQGDLGRFSTA
jgi:hypothetical protein